MGAYPIGHPQAQKWTVQVYPYGPDIQVHYEELVAAGVPDSQASDRSRMITVLWPVELRLPVIGDALTVGWASGQVASVSIDVGLPEDDVKRRGSVVLESGVEVRIHLRVGKW